MRKSVANLAWTHVSHVPGLPCTDTEERSRKQPAAPDTPAGPGRASALGHSERDPPQAPNSRRGPWGFVLSYDISKACARGRGQGKVEQRAKEKEGGEPVRKSDREGGLERTCESRGTQKEDTGGGTTGQESSRKEKDAHSRFLVAAARTGERARDVCKQWLACFAVSGVPGYVKPEESGTQAGLEERSPECPARCNKSACFLTLSKPC
ncbi:uncharacterized protein [Patagioenas fasciata]|uniref:uncharacterized protein n=1 Tax=Patagioenas fasciata TaxID=372321 RepID=UPI003A99F4BE